MNQYRHITSIFLAHTLGHDIILFLLPSHSLNLTQPLDVGIFGPLKTHISTALDSLTRTGVPRIEKVEWV